MAEIPKNPLTLNERKELAAFLTASGSMPIYTLHGFLCAVVSHSKVVTPEQWLSEIYREKVKTQSASEVESKLDLLFRFYNQIHAELREKSYFYPLVNINEYGRPVTLEDSTSLSCWCEGYFMALIAFEAVWDFEEESPQGELIMSLMAFAPEAILQDVSSTERGRKEMQELKEARSSIIEELPTLIAFTYYYNTTVKVEKDDRKEKSETFFFDAGQICPCESGEPFIACCGRVERSLH